MSFSNEAWQRIAPLYGAILDLPFNRELAAGTLGFGAVATGHHARVRRNATGGWPLRRGSSGAMPLPSSTSSSVNSPARYCRVSCR